MDHLKCTIPVKFDVGEKAMAFLARVHSEVARIYESTAYRPTIAVCSYAKLRECALPPRFEHYGVTFIGTPELNFDDVCLEAMPK